MTSETTNIQLVESHNQVGAESEMREETTAWGVGGSRRQGRRQRRKQPFFFSLSVLAWTAAPASVQGRRTTQDDGGHGLVTSQGAADA